MQYFSKVDDDLMAVFVRVKVGKLEIDVEKSKKQKNKTNHETQEANIVAEYPKKFLQTPGFSTSFKKIMAVPVICREVRNKLFGTGYGPPNQNVTEKSTAVRITSPTSIICGF